MCTDYTQIKYFTVICRNKIWKISVDRQFRGKTEKGWSNCIRLRTQRIQKFSSKTVFGIASSLICVDKLLVTVNSTPCINRNTFTIRKTHTWTSLSRISHLTPSLTHDAFPRLEYLTNICHSWILFNWWERNTFTNTGNFSFPHRLYADVTEFKGTVNHVENCLYVPKARLCLTNTKVTHVKNHLP
jgi:hypothetical protein